jgi:stage V sporulation protein R
MEHEHEGRDLKWNFADETLVNLHLLWKRPVHVETTKEGKKVRLSYDGKENTIQELG